jgi:hypothetical protein
VSTELSAADVFASFGNFGDSLIRRIELSTKAKRGGGRFRFDFDGVREWRFWQGN